MKTTEITAQRAFGCIQNHFCTLQRKGKEKGLAPATTRLSNASQKCFSWPESIVFPKKCQGISWEDNVSVLLFLLNKLLFSLRGTLQCALSTKWQKDSIVWIHGWKHMIVSSVRIRWEIWSVAMIKEFNRWEREREKNTFPEGSTW